MTGCSHCGEPMRGSAGLTLGGVHHRLCHPDNGMDCYRLVTVFRHPIVDCPCVDGVLPEGMLRTPANGYVGALQTLDEAIAAVLAVGEGTEEALSKVLLAERVTSMILECFNDRRGFDHWWDVLDPEIQAEIMQEISARVAGLLMKAEADDAMVETGREA